MRILNLEQDIGSGLEIVLMKKNSYRLDLQMKKGI